MKNEKHTRKEIIDIRLKQAGWNINDRTQVVEEFDIIILRRIKTLTIDCQLVRVFYLHFTPTLSPQFLCFFIYYFYKKYKLWKHKYQ